MSKAVNKDIRIFPKQNIALQHLRDRNITEVLYGGAAGGGKSRLGVMWLIEMCVKYPGTRWLMARRQLSELRATTLVSFFDHCRENGITSPKYWNYNQQSSTITFWNGSVIVMKDLAYQPNDPTYQNLGGYEFTGIFIDEVGEVDEAAKDILKRSCRYRLAEYGLTPKFLYTCNPCKTWPYKEFYLPSQKDQIKPGLVYIQALSGDNPLNDPSYAKMLSGLPKYHRDRLYLGLWETEPDDRQLMLWEDIDRVFENKNILVVNDAKILGTKYEDKQHTDSYITVDVARLGNDKTCIVLWRGLAAVEIHLLHKKTTDQTASFVRDLQQREAVPHKNIIVDSDGVGGGVVDQLRGCTAFVNNARPLHEENYANLKSQCYFALTDAVKRQEMFVQCDPMIRGMLFEELEQVRRKDGDDIKRMAVTSKDEVKRTLGRSPDISDALMLRMLPLVQKRKRAHTFDTVSVITW